MRFFKESTVIFKKSHTIITIDGKEATCEEEGVRSSYLLEAY